MRLWSQGRGWLFSTGKDPIGRPVARFISTTPEGGVQAPAPRGEGVGDIWLTQDALRSRPARACCPSCHGPFEVPVSPLLSLKPQLQEETLPGPGREAAASRGRLLREKQSPYPLSTSNVSGPEGQSDFLPQGHMAGQAWDGTDALLRSIANPSLPF